MRKLSILVIMILVIVSLSAASAADSNHTGDILQAPADNDNLEIDEITDNLQTEDSNASQRSGSLSGAPRRYSNPSCCRIPPRRGMLTASLPPEARQ